MHVSKSGTMYDIYVKNDYFYKKSKEAETSTTLDLSIDDYVNKVQASIPELKDVSKGEVCIHILPESSTDKSSGSTEDVVDDIIGITHCGYRYEADETVGAASTVSKNMQLDMRYDKSSVQSLLSKLKSIYSEDYDVGKYSESLKFEMTSSVNADGDTVFTLSRGNDVIGYEIANLNSELKYNKNLSQLQDGKLLLDGEFDAKTLLKQLIESLTQENSDTPLGSTQASKRLASVFNELQKK